MSVYADPQALEKLKTLITFTMDSILSSGQKFYSAVSGSQWDDNISSQAIDIYTKIIRTATEVLSTVDGTTTVLKEQVGDLNAYLNVKI